MRRRSSGLGTVLTLGTVFLVGAYAQRCASVTDWVPTERIENEANKVLGRDVPTASYRFSEAVGRDIAGYELQVSSAVTDGLLALPERRRADATRIGLSSLPDSTAYRIMEDRARR